MSMIDAALAYKLLGFKVFPTKIDKTPYTAHGLKDAASMDFMIKEYWQKWPDAGIGLVTDGFVVIDFDLKSGGKDSKEQIEAKYGKLPITRVHRTGGGGLHVIYRNPNGRAIRNTVKFGGYPGVDIRADGGYIVAPPSPHLSGKPYSVLIDKPIIDAPDWVLELCTAKPVLANNNNPDAPIPEGQRNQTLASLAGTMRRRGMPETAIEAALLEVNRQQCNPPLPDDDVRTIAKSVARYQPEGKDPLTEKTEILDVDTENAEKLHTTTEQVEHTEQTEQVETIEKFSEATETTKMDKSVWKLVDSWLQLHRGERFDLDTICRQLDITNREARQSVAKKLSYEVDKERLEKFSNFRPPIYTYINKDIKIIDWYNSTDDIEFPIVWPFGHEDDSHFGFDGAVQLSSGDVVIIAGVSNTGKTAMAINLVAENMDLWPVSLQGNEYAGGRKFKNRMLKLNWCNPLKEDGTPKFELIERHDNWADIIRPDNINIIDWLNLDGTSHPFYEIGSIIEGIQKKLRKGIAVICIQKDPNKELGMGGGFGQHLASLYLVVDFLPDKTLRMTVKKAKAWNGRNPNHEMYAFNLVDAGTKFHRIRQIEKCPACGGRGMSKAGGRCEGCDGSGHIEVRRNE